MSVILSISCISWSFQALFGAAGVFRRVTGCVTGAEEGFMGYQEVLEVFHLVPWAFQRHKWDSGDVKGTLGALEDSEAFWWASVGFRRS